MDWNMVKWFGVMVAAGVTTALAVEFVTKRLEDRAILAARSEMNRLVFSLQQQQMQPTPEGSPPPPPSGEGQDTVWL